MKTNRPIAVMLLIVFFLPKEALMSGMVERTSISDFVYIEKAVGMKFQRGSQKMNDAAHKKNRNRLDILQKEVDSLAKHVKSAIIDFTKVSKDTIEFDQIEDEYRLYKKGMSGYSRFPTLSSNEEAEKQVGNKCYFLLTEDPIIVVRFLKLPNLKQLELLKKVIKKAVNQN